MLFAPIEIGQWYKNQETNEIYEIVAADEAHGWVEIQYFSGEIEELELEDWQDQNLLLIPPPEDWSGPFEIMQEDLEFSDYPHHPENWTGPLAVIETDDLY